MPFYPFKNGTALRILSLSLALLLNAGCASAAQYLIEPAPLWVPTAVVAPQPTPVVTGALDASPTASAAAPKSRRKGRFTETPTLTVTETPTATLTPTQELGLYLLPFEDHRQEKALWSGRSIYEAVVMEPIGSTLLAQAWHTRPFSDSSFLWHRQFAYSLAQSGVSVLAAALPVTEEEGLSQAKESGAKLMLKGSLVQLNMSKRGADDFIGTNFTGTNYFLNLELKLRLIDVSSGKVLQERSLKAQRKFYDPKRLGSEDRDTFPRYFGTGLPELAMTVAGDTALRGALGLPTFTATPTTTQTPEAQKAAAGSPATPEPTATPDLGPYWVNPKTGERVDPNWNFDPKDGTPRDKFVLRQPALVTTPSRPTEAK